MTIEIVNYSNHEARINNFSRDRYVDPAYMEREWTEIWRTHWLLAGLVSDVASPGDFFVFDPGREQILITRTSNKKVQGFYNVCQHRGNQLVTEYCGHASTFRCAYHAWTYDIDGKLSIVPYRERFTGGLREDDLALKKVHTEIWNGLVFVNLSESPEPLEEFLGSLKTILEPYHFEKMTLVQDQTVHLDCNWKAVVDNFSELYHVDFLHPQHKRMVDCCNDTVRLFERGHTGVEVPGATVNPRFPVPEMPTDIQSVQLESIGLDPADFRGRVLEVRRAIQEQKRRIGRERGMDYDELTDNQLSDVWQYNLFPNAILSFTPEHCWILRPRPHPTDPARCEFDKLSLVRFSDPESTESANAILSAGRHYQGQSAFLPADYRRPERDLFHYDAVIAGEKSMTDTIDQDVELLAGVQKGMASGGFHRVHLNDDEMRVQHFHNELNRLIS